MNFPTFQICTGIVSQITSELQIETIYGTDPRKGTGIRIGRRNSFEIVWIGRGISKFPRTQFIKILKDRSVKISERTAYEASVMAEAMHDKK